MRRRHHLQPLRRGTFVAATLVLFLLIPQPAYAGVASTVSGTPGTNGTVFASARIGSLTVIGGNFTSVGGLTRRYAAAIRSDGTVDPNFKPNLNGAVHAVAGSGDGTRVFLGGVFTSVGGASRRYLAAVNLSGAPVSSWVANVSGTIVRSLAVSGSRLYVAGRYTGIDGKGLKHLAAVDVSSGNVVTAFAPRPNERVSEVVVSPTGTKVYAGGYFDVIGGRSRSGRVAELWSSNGAATAFNPTGLGTSYVPTVGLSVDGSLLYVANGRNYLFSYRLTSNSPRWRIETAGDTQAIAASKTQIYFGGHWPDVYSPRVDRQYLASVTPDGKFTSWHPRPGPTDPKRAGEVWAISLTSSHVVVGGKFTTMNGKTQRRLARFGGTP